MIIWQLSVNIKKHAYTCPTLLTWFWSLYQRLFNNASLNLNVTCVMESRKRKLLFLEIQMYICTGNSTFQGLWWLSNTMLSQAQHFNRSTAFIWKRCCLVNKFATASDRCRGQVSQVTCKTSFFTSIDSLCVDCYNSKNLSAPLINKSILYTMFNR